MDKYRYYIKCWDGGSMHKLVFVLLAFFAVVTFIRAFETSSEVNVEYSTNTEYSQAMMSASPSP
jgi:hypothetical protein